MRNDLEVKLIAGRTDADIAADAATMLKLHHEVPDSVKATVHHGHVALTGNVDWHYQRLQAEKIVRFIRGVRHVNNRLTLASRPVGHDMRRRITQALYHNATLDAKHIDVSVTGAVVHLRGTATSWQQREAAERAAYDAPGITMVDNQIIVDPPNDDNCEIC